jgi:SOS-response transcriptional repressor LexA
VKTKRKGYRFYVAKKKGHRTKHFRDAEFLKALGQHCLRLRTQKGLSIDRLSKESEQLSPSAIHRLETGAGAVTVLTLGRYAQALELSVRELVDFEPSTPTKTSSRTPKVTLIAWDSPKAKAQSFKTLLPLYSLKAAAGYFGAGEAVEAEGWLDVGGGHKLDTQMFVARALGDSMAPDIRDGDLLVFRADPTGTRQGKIVLAQYRGPADPDTGGSYTVKRYRSSKVTEGEESWRHRQIQLAPDNPDYEPIILVPRQEADFRIVAEFLWRVEK